MKLLVDECLSPALVAVAHARGHEAYHVTHRGWTGLSDRHLLNLMLEHDYTLATNNRDDFLALVETTELHPGLIVLMENVRRDEQIVMFLNALDHLKRLGSPINKVVEVAIDGTVRDYDLPAP